MVQMGKDLAAKNAQDPWVYVWGEAWLRRLCFDFTEFAVSRSSLCEAIRNRIPSFWKPSPGSPQAIPNSTTGISARRCSSSRTSVILELPLSST